MSDLSGNGELSLETADTNLFESLSSDKKNLELSRFERKRLTFHLQYRLPMTLVSAPARL